MGAQSLEPRVLRGYEILMNGDEPEQLDDSTFQVPSQSGNGVYLVSLVDREWRCECPDHMYRLVECKHIHTVKFWLALRDQIVSEVEETIPEIARALAAAATYIASTFLDERRTQGEIARGAGVSEVTIRNRYKELIQKLIIQVEL